MKLEQPVYEGEYELGIVDDDHYEVTFKKGKENYASFNFVQIPQFHQPGILLGNLEKITDEISREDLATFNHLMELPGNQEIFASFGYGKLIKAFFEKEERLGAVITSMDLDFYKSPYIGDLRNELIVNEKPSESGRNTYYEIEGTCFNPSRDPEIPIMRFSKGKFQQGRMEGRKIPQEIPNKLNV